MRKFWSICLWLGLLGCVMLLISQSGQRMTLAREKAEAVRRGDVLQALYEDVQAEYEEEQKTWEEEKTAWAAEEESLRETVETLTKELKQAKKEAEEQALLQEEAQRAMEAMHRDVQQLTQEKDTAEKRLEEVMAILRPAEEEREEPAEAGGEEQTPENTMDAPPDDGEEAVG